MIFFRPALWMSIFLLLSLAILGSLGTWQLQRLQWKQDLIAKLNASNSAPAVAIASLYDDKTNIDQNAAWKKVIVSGQYLADFDARKLYGLRDGKPGFYPIRLFKPDTGPVFFVVRGFVPDREAKNFAPPPSEKVLLQGLLRPVGERRRMVPSPDIEHGLWFWRDLPAMAEDLGFAEKFETRFTLDLIASDSNSPWPMPTGAPPTPVNNHLDYALTWFGLALVLLIIYLLWHRQNGRLRFG